MRCLSICACVFMLAVRNSQIAIITPEYMLLKCVCLHTHTHIHTIQPTLTCMDKHNIQKNTPNAGLELFYYSALTCARWFTGFQSISGAISISTLNKICPPTGDSRHTGGYGYRIGHHQLPNKSVFQNVIWPFSRCVWLREVNAIVSVIFLSI